MEKSMNNDLNFYINGEWVESDSNELIDVINPANEVGVGEAGFCNWAPWGIVVDKNCWVLSGVPAKNGLLTPVLCVDNIISVEPTPTTEPGPPE